MDYVADVEAAWTQTLTLLGGKRACELADDGDTIVRGLPAFVSRLTPDYADRVFVFFNSLIHAYKRALSEPL